MGKVNAKGIAGGAAAGAAAGSVVPGIGTAIGAVAGGVLGSGVFGGGDGGGLSEDAVNRLKNKELERNIVLRGVGLAQTRAAQRAASEGRMVWAVVIVFAIAGAVIFLEG